MKRIAIDYLKIGDLNLNEYNPNRHTAVSFDLLLKSIEVFGFTQPIVVHKQTRRIIDGEHRYRVASILDYEEVPVVLLDLDELQMRYATILHNRGRGSEDKELLQKLYEDIKKRGSDPEVELYDGRMK